MYSQQTDSRFYPICFYVITDLLFLIFSILYLIGDADHLDNFLKYAKPIPLWILIVQLWTLRGVNSAIYMIIWGLAFGSIGDILLLFGIFEGGAGAFLIGHIIDVYAFAKLAAEIATDRVCLKEVLNKQFIYIILWITLMTVSFWSISFIVRFSAQFSSIPIILSVYGSVLVMLVVAGFFFLFTTSSVSSEAFKAGLLFVFGSVLFFVSDNFIAHEKYNTDFPISPFWNSFIIMITYYVAQWLITKGAFMSCVWLTKDKVTENPMTGNNLVR